MNDQPNLDDLLSASARGNADLPPKIEEVDFGWFDYVRLPHCGEGYYSLEDAAILGALDIWSSNGIREFPLGDLTLHDADEPEVRTGITPMRARLLPMLLRAVENGSLKAEIMCRDQETSRPLTSRTFITVGDLIECLELHGFERGDYLQGMFEDESQSFQEVAQNRAQRRAEFRHAVSHEFERAPEGISEIESLKQLVHERGVQIAELQRQLTSGQSATTNRPMLTKEKNVLLKIIAALAVEAKIGLASASAAATVIESLTDQIGAHVSKRAIEDHLKIARQIVDRKA